MQHNIMNGGYEIWHIVRSLFRFRHLVNKVFETFGINLSFVCCINLGIIVITYVFTSLKQAEGVTIPFDAGIYIAFP